MQRRTLLQALPVLAGSAAMGGLAGCSTPPPPAPPWLPGPVPEADMPPPPPREFRAAWVATVSNIDWPSRPGLPPAAQRAEAVALLDRAREIGLNAIVLQVRPACDAIYPSALEPWSEVLTGTQGRAPQPAWDPLAFWVEQAHARALELHAWFNPYRARHGTARSPSVAPHVALLQPAIVRRYGDQLWLDPAEPAAAAHTLAVVADVLRRYDVDGVHIDDYFYPYPLGGPDAEQPFPDDAPWSRYRGPLSRDDWRREQVDRLVQALHRLVRELKPQVRFGISPFGLGKPALRPAGILGFSQYDKLYADVERWLAEGWLDYLAPQLYWPIARTAQAFPVLLDYWLAQNPHARHVWSGLFTSAIGRERDPFSAAEITDQVALLRTRPASGGHIHFSMVALAQDRDGIATRLRSGAYAQPALVPATPWLGGTPPAAPQLVHDGPVVRLVPGCAEARAWALWQRRGSEWVFAVQPAHDLAVVPQGSALVAAAVGRLGQLSPRVSLVLEGMSRSSLARHGPSRTPGPAA